MREETEKPPPLQQVGQQGRGRGLELWAAAGGGRQPRRWALGPLQKAVSQPVERCQALAAADGARNGLRPAGPACSGGLEGLRHAHRLCSVHRRSSDARPARPSAPTGSATHPGGGLGPLSMAAPF